MSRRRKHGVDLPLRVEARTWRNGKTVTYRYLSPTGEKVYLGNDLQQAMAAYARLVFPQVAVDLIRTVAEALEQHRAPRRRGEKPLVQFHSRAVINAAGRPPSSQFGNETTPTTTGRPALSAAPALRINNFGGVADGTRTHDDQNHNLGAQPAPVLRSEGDEGNSCD